jgi:hypothetical protein
MRSTQLISPHSFTLPESVDILANLVHTFDISLPTNVQMTLKEMETQIRDASVDLWEE